MGTYLDIKPSVIVNAFWIDFMHLNSTVFPRSLSTVHVFRCLEAPLNQPFWSFREKKLWPPYHPVLII